MPRVFDADVTVDELALRYRLEAAAREVRAEAWRLAARQKRAGELNDALVEAQQHYYERSQP
jgi:hypothetical protein